MKWATFTLGWGSGGSSYYKDGRRYRESSGSTKKTEAQRFLKGREGQVVEGRFNGLAPERIRYEDLETDFLNDYKINERKSRSLVVFNLRHLHAYFQGMKAKNITADRVRAYVASRKQEKTHYGHSPANATINRDLSALKRMFNLAMQAAKIDRAPHIEKLEENNVRHGFFNHHEYLQLRKELPDYLLPVVAFAYYTGMRRGEILSLRWAQINFADGTVRLEPGTTKNKEPRVVALAPDLFEEIVRQKKLRDERFPECQFIFFNYRKGTRIKDFRHAWETVTNKCGLKGRVFHDFRRTGVRNLVRAGVPERVAMAISGHRTRAVFDRYNIVDERDIQKASQMVQSYLHAQEASLKEKVTDLPR